MRYFVLFFAVLLLLSGCTDAQIERAEKAVVDAKAVLARSEAAEAQAASAVQIARGLAEQIGSEQAKAIVAKAEAALAVTEGAVESAKQSATVAEQTVAAAKTAQAAGGSTLDVLIAALSIAVPAAGALAVSIRKAITSGVALRQTVKGLDAARESMGDAAWDTHVAPALESAQDIKVKAQIALVQAKAA